jgi:phage-related protein
MLNRIRGGEMSFLRTTILATASLLLVVTALAQDPNVKHFDKDGLSFDYPANWQISDQSTQNLQYIQLTRDGFPEIRVRVPREWLKTPAKEAEAKKLIQDKYVNDFAAQVEQAGLNPKRSTVATQISGADAEGARVRAMLDGQPGGMDSYFRVVSDRFVQLSTIGSEKEITKSTPVWDMIRNSLKVELPPQPKATPSPSPAKGKP